MRLQNPRSVMSGGGGHFRVGKKPARNPSSPLAKKEMMSDMKRLTIYFLMGLFFARNIFGRRPHTVDLERL
jgi:hypothetical protein